ncbi:MAG: hypothetical protein FWE57_10280 [Chitinispirillia bacterium]|nr:hypothetical protein [Chitinispirillia bacterium]
MKKTLAFVLAAGCVVGSYATDARVEVMGKHDAFFRDEISVFRNPADMSLYPNMLYGSYGWVDKDIQSVNNTLTRDNLVLSDPFFGAMISHKLGEEESSPMFSVGAFMNRRDRMLDLLMTAGRDTVGTSYGSKVIRQNLKEPVGKADLMFGYDLGNGIALGLGTYIAYQKEKSDDKTIGQTGVYKVTAGINWNLDQGLDFEASFNGGSITGRYMQDGDLVDVADGNYFYRGDVRFFSAVPAIHGAFVPQVSMEIMKLGNREIIDVAGGIGLNMNIDRGFFWAGLQGLYNQANSTESIINDAKESIGGRVSFGIERNIMWDWFLIRVGGQKEIRYVTEENGKKGEWIETNKKYDETSGITEDGLVGLGFGVNIDNRLRIDFVSSNDIAYTFTNLISGPQLSLFKRISATYRF